MIAILDASRVRVPLSGLALLVALAPLACLMLFLATISAVASPVASPVVSSVASPVATPVDATAVPTQSVVASPVAMQRGIPLTASFSSVELRNGGKVHLVHGQSQRVTLLKGDAESIGITIGDDGRLVIDRCLKRCAHRHDLEVEVATPALTTIAVRDGGTIQSRGDFSYQPEIGVAVREGGTIDIRSMAVGSVTASVYSGGRIFLKPATALSAGIEQGGVIIYWGDAAVTSSVRYGGAVVKGLPADADKLLAEFGPVLSHVPPVPPGPAVPAGSAVPSVPADQPINL